MPNTYTFKLSSVKDPYRFDSISVYGDVKYIDWPSIILCDDSEALGEKMSEALNQQIKNNHLNLGLLETQFKDNVKDTFTFLDGSSDSIRIREYKVSENSGLMFLKHLRDNIEVLCRDFDALTKVGNVESYVTLLIHGGEYYGHIYNWLSPVDKDICLCMGIRSRIDSLLLKEEGSYLGNVSLHLLEGVRKFCLSRGITEMYILSPLQSMVNILENLNSFERTILKNKFAGDFIAPYGFLGFLEAYKCVSTTESVI